MLIVEADYKDISRLLRGVVPVIRERDAKGEAAAIQQLQRIIRFDERDAKCLSKCLYIVPIRRNLPKISFDNESLNSNGKW